MKVDHTLPLCEQPASAAGAGDMGWEQLTRQIRATGGAVNQSHNRR